MLAPPLLDSVPLKPELDPILNDLEKLFSMHGEVRKSEYLRLMQSASSSAITSSVLDNLIKHIEAKVIAESEQTKNLVAWVNMLHQAFSVNLTHYGKKEKYALFKPVEASTGKTFAELEEIFQYIEKGYSKNSKNSKKSRFVLTKFILFFLLLFTLIITLITTLHYQGLLSLNIFSNKHTSETNFSHATNEAFQALDIKLKAVNSDTENATNTLNNALAHLIINTKPKVKSENIKIKRHNTNEETAFQYYQANLSLPYGHYDIEVMLNGYEHLQQQVTLNKAKHEVNLVLRKILPEPIQQLTTSLIKVPTGLFTFLIQKNNKVKQQHYINGFELMNTEVTFAMWDSCYQHKQCQFLPRDYDWGRGERPVVDVSLQAIEQQFIPWLNHLTGDTYALPTEGQWEYAASFPELHHYAWGEVFMKSSANCLDCGSQWDNTQTAPVKSFPSNSKGFYDLNGNVWELTKDCWSDHLTKPQSDGGAWLTEACDTAVIKGGSYMAKAKDIKFSTRNWVGRTTRSKSVGFRLIKQIEHSDKF